MTDRELDALATEKILGGGAGIISDRAELAALIEDEIERRGLLDDYATALLSMKTESGYIQSDYAFLIRATPAQRRDAALKATGNL